MKNLLPWLFGILVVAHCGLCQYTTFSIAEDLRAGHIVPMAAAVQDLASCNASLNDRIERARLTVNRVNEENTRLKGALQEGVDMLKDEIEENNRLNDKIEDLTWRNTILQNILDKLGTDEDETFEP